MVEKIQLEKDIARKLERQKDIERINKRRQMLNLPKVKTEDIASEIKQDISKFNIQAEQEFQKQEQQLSLQQEQEAIKSLNPKEAYYSGMENAGFIKLDKREIYYADTGKRFTGKINGQEFTNEIIYNVGGEGEYVGIPKTDYKDTSRGREKRITGFKIEGEKITKRLPYENKEGQRKLKVTELKSEFQIDKDTYKFDPEKWKPRKAQTFEFEYTTPEQPGLKPEYFGRYPELKEQSPLYQERMKTRFREQQTKESMQKLQQLQLSREKAKEFTKRATQELKQFQERVTTQYTPQLQKKAMKTFEAQPEVIKQKFDVKGVTFEFERIPKKSEEKMISGTISEADIKTKTFQQLAKKDPRLARSIQLYQQTKKEGTLSQKAIAYGGELAISFGVGAGLGSVVGFGVKGLAATKLATKVTKIPKVSKVAKILPKVGKVGFSTIVGASAARTAEKEGLAAGVKKLGKEISFIVGFERGARTGAKAFEATAKAYEKVTLPIRKVKFQRSISKWQKSITEKSKTEGFTYTPKEAIYTQRTLTGGTISPERAKFLRSSIDQNILLRTGKQTIERSIKPPTTTFERTGQTKLKQDVILAYDRLQNKIIKIKSIDDFAIKSSLVDPGRYSFETITPQDKIIRRSGRVFIESPIGQREAFRSGSLITRPDITIKETARTKDLTEFGFKQPVIPKRQTPLSELVAAKPKPKITKPSTPKPIKKTKGVVEQRIKPTESFFRTSITPSYSLYEETVPISKQAKELQKAFFAVPRIDIKKDSKIVERVIPTKDIITTQDLRLSVMGSIKPDVVQISRSKIKEQTIQMPKQDVFFDVKPKQDIKIEVLQKTELVQDLKLKQDMKQQQRLIQKQQLKYPLNFNLTPQTPIPKTPTAYLPIPIFPKKEKPKEIRIPTGKFQTFTDYTPSLTALALDIRAEPTEFGQVTGLGIRPIPIKRRR